MPCRQTVLACLILSASVQVGAAADNLLRNADFEDALEPAWHKRTPDGAERKLYRTDAVAHSGKSCVVLENVKPTFTRLRQGHDRSVRIEPGYLAELSAWVKSAMSDDPAITLQCYCMDAKGKILAQPTGHVIADGDGWVRGRARCLVPDGTQYVMAYLQVKGGVGKVYFDDVSLHVVRKPAPRKPQPRVGLLTDLAADDACLKSMRTLLGDGLVMLDAEGAARQVKACAAAVVLWRDGRPSKPALDAVASFARSGGKVFMDMRSFAAWQGARATPIQVGANDSSAWCAFDGPAGAYSLKVHYADESDGAGRIVVFHNAKRLDAWTLDRTPAKTPDKACTRDVGAVTLARGDRIALALTPHSGESCRVDAIELRGNAGKLIRIEAESMNRGRLVSVEKPALMFVKGIKARSMPVGASMSAGLRVVKQGAATGGWQVGQTMPRAGATGELLALPAGFTRPGLDVLAVGAAGEPGLVALRVGRGVITACDVLSLDEPHWRKVGAYYKYLPVTASTVNPVRFGEYYPKRLTYAEIVEHMKQIAARYPQITLKEEGPSTGELPIYSLNLGKPGAPLYFIYAAAHGSEWEPGYGVMTFAKRVAEGRMADVVDLDTVSIKIVPYVNPWGYDHHRRQNANGVDLNRQGDYRWTQYKGRDSNKDGVYGPRDYDFKGGSPFSEPESRTYKAILDAAPNLHCVLDFHGNASATNNKLSILPRTAHADNETRGFELERLVNERLAGRHLLWQNDEDAPSQYIIARTYLSGPSPFIINTSAHTRFGTLVELTAGYRSTYGTVLQTDVTCEICRGLFVAFGR